MLSLVFEQAGLDPTVVIGANIPQLGGNARVGKGKKFIVEADEFFDNFLNYRPEAIILNNIEFDHPDYFRNEAQLFDSFKKHVYRLQGKKILVYNSEDKGINRLLKLLPGVRLKNINLYPYKRENWSSKFSLGVPGEFNKLNAFGVITLARLYGIDEVTIIHAMRSFRGIGRRLELLNKGNEPVSKLIPI